MNENQFYLDITPLLKCENDRHFFEELFEKLKIHLGISNACIASALNLAETDPKKMRIMAGKSSLHPSFWQKCALARREDLFFHLGDKKNQYYFLLSPDVALSKAQNDFLNVFVSTYFDISLRIAEMKKNQDLIYIDDVSGLYNQRKLNLDLNLFIERYERHKHTFCVLFMDVDFFKKVNDSHGHLVGTKILEMLALEFKSLLRDGDLLYRYGGDEFVVLLPDTLLEGGKIVGERILSHIKKHYFEISTHDKHLTLNMSLSIGVAECPKDAKSLNELLSFADRMMYGAKSSGRGTVFYAQDELGHKNKRA